MQILPSLVSGGVERGTVEMARAIAEQGWRSLVVSNGGAMVSQLSRHSEHILLPVHRRNPLAILSNSKKLAALIRKENISLIHARSRAPAWSALLAARRCGIPFVTTFHGFYGRKGLFKQWYNSVMVKGDRVIAISDFIRDHILKHYDCAPERVITIHRGADLNLFSPKAIRPGVLAELSEKWQITSVTRPIILMPGRLTRWKGQHLLVDALARIKDIPFLALILGDDSGHPAYKEALEKQIYRLGLAEHVRFVGKTASMTEAYALSDLVVVPSIEPEAFGRVPVEAQAMGKLVIASDHGGARETVEQGETGFLFPPGDAAALAAVLKKTLELPQARREILGQQAQKHIEAHFTITRMQEKTLALYQSLL